MRAGLKSRLKRLETEATNTLWPPMVLHLFAGEEVPDKYAGWIGGTYLLRAPVGRPDDDLYTAENPEMHLPAGVLWADEGGDDMWWAKLRDGEL